MMAMDFSWSDDEKTYFLEASVEERRNAMANAFLARDWEAFQWMLGKGIHPNDVAYDMLWDAVRKQDEDAVRRLLALNYDVHRVDDVAFRDAVRLGNSTLAQLLKQAGADPRAVNDESMSLAAERGDVLMIRQLRSWGVPAEGWKNDPLVRATEAGSRDAVKELLRLGATLEDKEGHYLPVRAAIRRNDTDLGKLLLKHLKNIPDVLDKLEEASAFLPDDWRHRVERWRLALAMG
jgi:ankyrin repeat protein